MSRVRCAIYTRKSTEDGLEQDFNSLDAQREACEAYVASQKHEGWRALPALYDDGGFSGGTVERPALQRLLADIDARKIDVIVVYKVDRLSRSLADFARLVERFDATDVSFVSVTQQFNTASSMGRLTLNVLLSFAQFEREVTAERIRDKIAASRKKGMWMGGPPPLGYDNIDKQLVVNAAEADVVRDIFQLYLQLGSVRELRSEIERRGYITKRRVLKDGAPVGGAKFSAGRLYHLLRNPTYVGRVTHKDAVYPGLQDAIVDEETWDAVQAELERKRRRHASGGGARYPSLLIGKVEDDRGRPLTSSHATKSGRRYRYYISRPDQGVEDGWRIPAKTLEAAVTDTLVARLTDRAALARSLEPHAVTSSSFESAAALVETLRGDGATERSGLLDRILNRVIVSDNELTVEIGCATLLDELGIHTTNVGPDAMLSLVTPMRIARRGVEMKLVLPGSAATTNVDATLVRAIASGRLWFDELVRGDVPSQQAIAVREGLDVANVKRQIGLAFLAPDVVTAILEGRQPAHLTAARLTRLYDLPLDWAEQRRALGFGAAALQQL